MGKGNAAKLVVSLTKTGDDNIRKVFKKMKRKDRQKVIELLFKQADNLTLIENLFTEIGFRKQNRLLKILIKKKERQCVLEWYIDKIVSTCNLSNDDEDESELSQVSRGLFKPLRIALSKNIDAFHVIATKINIQNDPMLLLRFIDETKLTLNATIELAKLDINGYFGYTKSGDGTIDVICKLDYLRQLKNHVQRIAYILDNLKFGRTNFDPDKFDECCVCLDKPIDVVINKCNHFTCGKCFFTMMDRTMFKVVCPVCRSLANGIYELEYAYYPMSLSDNLTDVYRHGHTVIAVESNGHAVIYT